MSTISVRTLGGEVWAELTTRMVRKEGFHTLSVETMNEIIDLLVGVLARHMGKTIQDDLEFPVQPLSFRSETQDS